jgi:AAA family ATP:ADP antiporter
VNGGQQRAAAVTAASSAALIVAQQVGGKATRDALFLTTFAPTDLPKAMVGAAVLSIASALLMSRIIARRGPARTVPLALGLSACLFLLEWSLLGRAPGPIAVLVYLHTSVFSGLVISGFWTVVNERFDPHAARKVVGRIGAGAAFGGAVGGVTAQQVATVFDLRSMLTVLAMLNLLSAIGVIRTGSAIEAGRGQLPVSAAGRPSGLKILGSVPYLRQMAALIMLAACTSALIEYVLKSEAAYQLRGDRDLVSFFALFYTGVSVLTFLVQSAVSGKALGALGLAGTVAVLPAAVAVAGVLAAAHPALWAVILLAGVESVLGNSLFRSGYEPLYTPLPNDRKRPVKVVIDVACVRLGSAAGGGLVMLLLLLNDRPGQLLMGIAVALAAASLWDVYQLHHGYVGALADSLRSGAIALDDAEVVDATTRRTLSDTTHALNREQLLAEIAAFRMRQQRQEPGAAEGVGAGLAGRGESPQPCPPEEALCPLVNDLLSRDTERARKALRSDATDPLFAAAAVRLLGHGELVRDALAALRRLAPRIAGQLTVALLDVEQPLTVRQRIPWVLKVLDDGRARDGLLDGLSDTNFEVRHSCGRALKEMRRRDPALAFSAELVFKAVGRELREAEAEWKRRGSIELDPHDAGSGAGDTLTDGKDISLDHVFTLLGLALDPDTVQIALRALQGADRRLHGTALEYLENVLPEPIRRELWPRLGAARPAASAPRRPPQQVEEELRRSAIIDLSQALQDEKQ